MNPKYKHAVLLAVGEHHSGAAKEGERIVEAVFEALSAALAEDGKKVLGRDSSSKMDQAGANATAVDVYLCDAEDIWTAMHDAAACELMGGVDE